jgi:hypothetical protein
MLECKEIPVCTRCKQHFGYAARALRVGKPAMPQTVVMSKRERDCAREMGLLSFLEKSLQTFRISLYNSGLFGRNDKRQTENLK